MKKPKQPKPEKEITYGFGRSSPGMLRPKRPLWNGQKCGWPEPMFVD